MGDRGKCQVCSKTSESRCSWCRLVFYCSKEHQKQDWDSHKVTCSKKKYSVEHSESGRPSLVATEDIKPDWILLKDRPILLSLKANSLDFTPNTVCLGCYKEIKVDEDEAEEDSSTSSDSSATSGGGSGTSGSGGSSTSGGERRKVCTKCQLPICSVQCSAQHFHKGLECRLISEAGPFTPELNNDEQGSIDWKRGAASTAPNIRETILRNLLYFRCILLKNFFPSSWEEMMTLAQSPQEEEENLGKDLPRLQRSTRMFTLLKAILQHINHPRINQVHKPDVHKILWILDMKSLHFNISQEVELSAVFPTFSLLSHSCVPNVKYYLNPTLSTTGSSGSSGKYVIELYCRSAVKIKKGDQLAVSFVNLCWNTEKRHEFLRKEKGLSCFCPRCEDPSELGSNFSTIICSQETCNGYALPSPKTPPQTEMQWKCSKCNKMTPPWAVKKLDNRLCEMVGRTKPNLLSYKKLIAKMDELVHPDYYLSFVVNHSLVQMYGDKDADNDSEDENVRMHNKKMLEDKVALCNRLLQMIKRLDPGLAKLNIYTAVMYYEMQSAILAMGGGEVDDDFDVLRHKPETVKLAKLYLQKCMDSFKYELLDVPENKLKKLAQKKMEYLDFIVLKFKR